MRRTRKQIDADIQKIKSAVTTATSFKELESLTGLSNYKIRKSLENYPDLYKMIKRRVAQNKVKSEAKTQAKLKADEVTEVSKAVEISVAGTETDIATVRKIVIDASISGTKDLRAMLENLLEKNMNFIITSTTLRELDQMQKFNDNDGSDARYILAMAVENPEKFSTVPIDESLDTPDDCIIEYCINNLSEVTLLTSDKVMGLKARMYGVDVWYLKHTITPTPPVIPVDRMRTLFPAIYQDKKLVISCFKRYHQWIRVISDDIEYNSGSVQLNVGDDVYIIADKGIQYTFSHFRITQICAEMNCELVFAKAIKKGDSLNGIPKASYRDFIMDVKGYF